MRSLVPAVLKQAKLNTWKVNTVKKICDEGKANAIHVIKKVVEA